ncbi:MAG: methyltransferase domain-containing protein [Candidatus Dependentiae bacterium]
MKKIILSVLAPLLSYANYLDRADINIIYERFVKPNYTHEYTYRYDPLPIAKNNKAWRWEHKDFPRVIALLEFERFVQENQCFSVKGLAINGKDPEWAYISHQHVSVINYSHNPEKYDLHVFELDEHDFDFVMVNQTFEHVYDPIRCLKNIFKYMKPGGILYFNVPTTSIPHETPYHFYTGFTPVGIGAMLQEAGFELLSIGQWGNFEYLKKAFETQGFPDYRMLSNPGINHMHCPIIAWAFARKPENNV